MQRKTGLVYNLSYLTMPQVEYQYKFSNQNLFQVVFKSFFQHYKKYQNADYKQIWVFREGFLPVVTTLY
jgi:hypothetical protein